MTPSTNFLSLFESDLAADLSSNADELQAFAKQLAQKVGIDQQEAPQEQGQEEVNEEIVTALLLSAPGVISLTGKLLGLLNKPIKSDQIEKAAKALDHYGHKVHGAIISTLMVVIKPLTFWMPAKHQKTVATALLVTILLYKIISTYGAEGISHLLHPDGETVAHQALNAIKAVEVKGMLKDFAPFLASLKGG